MALPGSRLRQSSSYAGRAPFQRFSAMIAFACDGARAKVCVRECERVRALTYYKWHAAAVGSSLPNHSGRPNTGGRHRGIASGLKWD